MSGYGGGGGFDNDTPSRGGGSADGSKPRRNYDEQSLIPVTAKMIKEALGDPSGGTDMNLKDGRALHMIKLVGAVRNHEERSTNVFIDVEDGTGLVQVKVWVNEGDECSAAASLRQQASMDHVYIRIIGQIREFEGQRQIIANDVRPISSGNELTYHLLEVAHSYEKYRKAQSDNSMAGMNGMGMGIGIGKMATISPSPRGVGMQPYGNNVVGGNGIDDAVVQVIRSLGCEYIFFESLLFLFHHVWLSPYYISLMEQLFIPDNPPPYTHSPANAGSGIHVDQIIQQVASQGFSAGEIKNVISNLSNEGHIYSTIDENHFQYAE